MFTKHDFGDPDFANVTFFNKKMEKQLQLGASRSLLQELTPQMQKRGVSTEKKKDLQSLAMSLPVDCQYFFNQLFENEKRADLEIDNDEDFDVEY